MTGLLEALSPIQALNKLYNIDPASAKFLVGGVSVFAAASIVASYGTDVGTMALIGLYVIGMALLLIIVSNLSALLRRVLGTFLVLLIISTVMLFFCAVTMDWPKPAYCLAKFWLPCQAAAQQTAETNASTIDATVNVPEKIALPATPPVQPSPTASATLGPAIEPAVATAASQPVFIQFAGLITQDSIVSLNAALRRGGWNVQSSSGERIAEAAGLNEVRYSDPRYLSAARSLADAVTATGITSRPVTLRLAPMVGTNLELWISN